MPDLTVIDGGGPPKDQRLVEHKVRQASCELAANILRIIRGAGKPEALVGQMKDLLDAGFDYQDVAGHWPIDTIAEALRIRSEYAAFMETAERGDVDQARIDRMHERQTFEKMIAEHNVRRGALQAIASRLVGQYLQEAAGDRQMRDGIYELDRIGEERRKADRQAARQARAAAPTKQRRTRKAPTKAKEPL